jgi:hypothetical protein
MRANAVKILFSLLIIATTSSCDRKSCKDVVCGVNQQCNNGACICNDGYEGGDCQTESFQKYIGSYNVTESCYSSVNNFGSYSTYIQADYNYVNRIIITSLFGYTNATGIIHTDQSNQGNYIEIPYQTQGALSFSGQGTFDPYTNRMSLDLNYTYNGGSYQCTHTFYKY